MFEAKEEELDEVTVQEFFGCEDKREKEID